MRQRDTILRVPSDGVVGADGYYLDSAIGMTLVSNAYVLQREACRHIGWCVRSAAAVQNASGVWAGIEDASDPAADGRAHNTLAEIPWDLRTSIQFGPFVYTKRKLRCDFVGTVTGGSLSELKLYAALTKHDDPRLLVAGDAITFASTAIAGTITSFDKSITLDAIDVRNVTDWQARTNERVLSPTCYLWAGWRAIGTGTVNFDQIAVFEVL